MITFSQLGNYGRLGNQLFQVAGTIGIAEKNNQPWCFPEWNNPFTGDFHEYIKHSYKQIYVPWGYKDVVLGLSFDYDIHGYLQSEKYFNHCRDRIKELFTFRESIEVINPFIAVHIRRGDYMPDYYAILGREYYDKALSMLPDLPVYVFTDDCDKAKEVVKADQYFCGDPFYDLNLMTKAEYIVIANSSYSWWGAWLSDAKRVIAPVHWFGPLSPFNTIDLIPERYEQIV